MKQLVKVSRHGFYGRPGVYRSGDRTQFFGVWFVHNGTNWQLADINHNVITCKNTGSLKQYRPRPVNA